MNFAFWEVFSKDYQDVFTPNNLKLLQVDKMVMHLRMLRRLCANSLKCYAGISIYLPLLLGY